MLSNLVDRYRRFKNKYIVQQRRQHEYAINRYYAHIIDPFFTKLVYDLRLTPNAVTVITGLLGVGSGIAFLYHWWILGAVLLQLHHYFDGADGNLARLTNRCTPFGAKLDQVSDQLVKLVLFICLAIGADIALWAKIALPLSIWFDLWIVHYIILPFARKHSLKRARWKMWFLDRGIIPGFDIFTIYFLISLSALTGWLNEAIYAIVILKNVDWLYRLWECVKTAWSNRVSDSNRKVSG